MSHIIFCFYVRSLAPIVGSGAVNIQYTTLPVNVSKSSSAQTRTFRSSTTPSCNTRVLLIPQRTQEGLYFYRHYRHSLRVILLSLQMLYHVNVQIELQ